MGVPIGDPSDKGVRMITACTENSSSIVDTPQLAARAVHCVAQDGFEGRAGGLLWRKKALHKRPAKKAEEVEDDHAN